MARLVAGLYDRVRHLIPELAKFGVVGGIGAVVDLGGAAVLHGRYHQEPLTAKAISITVATVVTYIGSRFWTFRHRENQALHRETVLFFALNVVGLIIAELVIACTTYILGFKDPIAYNLASVIGTGLGTIFRFFAYRKWVFLAPAAPPPAPAAATAAYAPWELMREEPSSWDWQPGPAMAPAYSAPRMEQPREVMLQNSVFPNGVVAPHLATATAPPVGAGWSSGLSSGLSSAPSRPAARPAPPGPRTPGRHRKTR